ncbi:MAG: NPCBM/NEW2 domain-containing protein [Tepidisphaeraceae bacterium]
MILLTSSCAAAFAQSAWTLTTSDFQTRPVDLAGIDDAGAKVREHGASAESSIAWNQILQLQRAGALQSNPGKFTLHLTNGDRVSGEALELAGESLAWSAPAAGRVDVKLKQVVAITKAGEQPPRRDAAQPPRTEDVVSLTNGDTARGLVFAVDKAGITVQADGNPVTVPWESVRTVTLASVTDDAAAKSERGVRVTLADGSVLSDSRVALQGDKAILGAGDAKREVLASAVIAIEQVNGPVAWLSSLAPSESVQTPFLETVFPARMDRTVRGEPIRFGDRTFPRGIGVHAYSRLTWQLPQGRYKAFRTQYAIDGDKPFANVTVRVKLDDKVVHETTDFVAGTLADVVRVPLGNAKTLTLEVDYGKTYDVQDRFSWIEPALLVE